MQNHGFRIRVLLQRESRSDAKSPFDSRLRYPPQRQIRNLMIVRIYPADVAVASGEHHFLRIAALHRLIRKETSAFVPCDGMARLRHTPRDTAVFLSVYAHGRIHRVPDPEIFHTSGMQTLFLPEGGNCFWVVSAHPPLEHLPGVIGVRRDAAVAYQIRQHPCNHRPSRKTEQEYLRVLCHAISLRQPFIVSHGNMQRPHAEHVSDDDSARSGAWAALKMNTLPGIPDAGIGKDGYVCAFMDAHSRPLCQKDIVHLKTPSLS